VLTASSITVTACGVENVLPTEMEKVTWSVGIATRILAAGGSAAGKVILAYKLTGCATAVTSRSNENFSYIYIS
jgi:hypothetical protein